MRTRQVAVPLVAAVLGSAITAAALLAGGGTNSRITGQGLLTSSAPTELTTTEIYDRAAPSVVFIRAQTVKPGATAFYAQAGNELALSTGSCFVLDWDGVFNSGEKTSTTGSSFSEVDSMGLNLLRYAYYLVHGKMPVTLVISGEKNESRTISPLCLTQ